MPVHSVINCANFFRIVCTFGLLWLLAGCVSKPDGVVPVQDFDVNRYLGTWYEIARLDHSFERGLSQVSANYTLREDGGISVLNKGYSEAEKEWNEAEGKAYFVDDMSVGHLKVSFFGPFYSSYIIFELGENYDYAFIAGYNHNYLWLLSRTPDVDDAMKARFLAEATARGFDTAALIWPAH